MDCAKSGERLPEEKYLVDNQTSKDHEDDPVAEQADVFAAAAHEDIANQNVNAAAAHEDITNHNLDAAIAHEVIPNQNLDAVMAHEDIANQILNAAPTLQPGAVIQETCE